MTYGVPYSFVPGTKAKADEVNANFIEILNKIETTNSRIDETNTKIDETNTELNKTNDKLTANEETITNQDTSINELSNKLDGNWTEAMRSLITSATTIAASGTKGYDLSKYLPDDGSTYEIIGSVTCGKSAYACDIGISSSLVSEVYRVCTCSTSSKVSASFIIPIGTSRTVTLNNLDSGVATINIFRIFAYRKVR